MSDARHGIEPANTMLATTVVATTFGSRFADAARLGVAP